MNIIKRNGVSEDFNPVKITQRIKAQAKGLNVNTDQLFVDVIKSIANDMKSIDIDELIVNISATKKILHPDYGKLAARVAATRLQKECKLSLLEIATLGLSEDVLSKKYLDIVTKFAPLVEGKINNSKDMDFDIFGLQTVIDRYLLRVNNRVIETPQQMYMRIAFTVVDHNENDDDVIAKAIIKTYNLLSDGYYTHATPTMMNAGRKKQQLSSCFLLETGDSLEELMDTNKELANLSKHSGGIGLSITPIRAEGTMVAGIGKSQGLMPALKNYETILRWFNQLGMRRGAGAMYLEPWHKDIMTFLDIRKNQGKEEMRARDLFTALWACNLFFERVKNDGDWYLFCPHEILIHSGIKLQDLYGKAFEDAYIRLCEDPTISKVKVRAVDVFTKAIESQIETGAPYIGNKDEINLKSNQKNAGVVKSSNLCIEVVQVATPDEIANCNLASTCLNKFVENGVFNFKKLYEVILIVAENTDNVIDVNYYPEKKAEYSNMKLRPIGIGVQGLADVFAKMKISFDSVEAKKLNKEIFETIYFAALTASKNKAIAYEKYKKFNGSPASEGILQFDMWKGTELSGMWDFDTLKEEIIKYGLRNSLLVALMPTASTSLILDNNECFEPFVSNAYARNTLTGTFQVINKHLVKDLEELGLWNENTGKIIIANDGSVNTINPSLRDDDRKIVQEFLDQIPNEVKAIYKTIWEYSMKTIIDMAADRAPFVDQTQSMNLFISDPTVSKVGSMHLYSYNKKLKTMMYYLRTKTKTEANKKLGLNLEDNKNLTPKRPENSMFECVGCSA